jgi:hypothetical protein
MDERDIKDGFLHVEQKLYGSKNTYTTKVVRDAQRAHWPAATKNNS